MKLVTGIFTFLVVLAVTATAEEDIAITTLLGSEEGSSSAEAGTVQTVSSEKYDQIIPVEKRNNRYTTVLLPKTYTKTIYTQSQEENAPAQVVQNTYDSSSQENGDSSETGTNVRVVKLDGPVSDNTIHQVSAVSGTQDKTLVNYIKSFHDRLQNGSKAFSVENVVKTVGKVVKDTKETIINKTKDFVEGITNKNVIKENTEKIVKDLSIKKAAIEEKVKNVVEKVTDVVRNIKLPPIDIPKTIAFVTGVVQAIGVGISIAAFIGLILREEIKLRTKNGDSNPLDSIANSLHIGTTKYGSSDDTVVTDEGKSSQSTEVTSDEEKSVTGISNTANTASTADTAKTATVVSDADSSDSDDSDSVEDESDPDVIAQPTNVAPAKTNQQPILQQQSSEQQSSEITQLRQQPTNQQVYTEASSNAQATAGSVISQQKSGQQQLVNQQTIAQTGSQVNSEHGPHVTRVHVNRDVNIVRRDGPGADNQAYEAAQAQAYAQRLGQQYSQGQGQVYSQGQNQALAQGLGQSFAQGQGQAFAQGQGQAFTQGQGQAFSQGQRQIQTVNRGQTITQVGPGQIPMNFQNWAQANSPPQGQVHTMTRAQAYSQAQGQVNPQAQGLAFSQVRAG